MILLDLFCGTNTKSNPSTGFGWSRVFAKRGWYCLGVDLQEPYEVPLGCKVLKADVLSIRQRLGATFHFGVQITDYYGPFDAIVASSPCEEFSVHGMKHFHPNPKYPENGIRLFNHTRQLCESAGVPYVIENVRAAQQFVGSAVRHAGPYYLWGTGVPTLIPPKIAKPFRGASGSYMEKCPPGMDRKKWRMLWQKDFERRAGGRKECPALAATIPPELANCVAEYFERILERQEVTA